MSLGLLAWMGSRHDLPQKIAVTCQDRYLLGLLIRHARKKLKRRAQILPWTAAENGRLRAEIEEVPLFGPKPLYVILGAPKSWVKTLTPHRTTYVVSQQPLATLQGETYHHTTRSLLLRVLVDLLDLPWGVADLKRVDWTWAHGWGDFEPLLARGKILGWSVSDLMRAAAARPQGDLFALIRDREVWAFHFLAKRYGAAWLYRSLMDFSVKVAQCQSLKLSGSRLREILGLTQWELEQVQEAAKRTDPAELQYFCNRLMALDPVISRSPQGLDLFLLGSKI